MGPNRKRNLRNEEATSRTQMKVIHQENSSHPKRIVLTNPIPNNQDRQYQPPILTKVLAESSIILAQDLTTYIDQKLAEFC